MSSGATQNLAFAPAAAIARRFVAARREALALPFYPGPLPPDLASAYAVQDAAIALWPDAIAGWKIGRIAPELEGQYGQSRLAGPIFARAVRTAKAGETMDFPVFPGGFSAVEAEFVFEIAHDAPFDKYLWSEDDARAIAGRLFVGVETAGSPLMTINALGPTAVISDFGNNAGLILGGAIDGWRESPVESWRCETWLGGALVGRGAASDLPGGPIAGLRFLLAHCARRGRPLKAGMLASSGAVTGIHDIAAGQTARIAFGAAGAIACRAVAATQEDAAHSG